MIESVEEKSWTFSLVSALGAKANCTRIQGGPSPTQYGLTAPAINLWVLRSVQNLPTAAKQWKREHIQIWQKACPGKGREGVSLLNFSTTAQNDATISSAKKSITEVISNYISRQDHRTRVLYSMSLLGTPREMEISKNLSG